MKKKEFNAAKQWENILYTSIKYEIIIYKYLCSGLGKKERKKLKEEHKFTTYKSWEGHILNLIDNLEKEQLKEFRRFLNNQEREHRLYNLIFNNFMTPFLLMIFGSFMLDNMIWEIKNIFSQELNIITEIILFFLFIGSVIYALYFIMKKMFVEYKNGLYENCFFADVLEIVNCKLDNTHHIKTF